MPSPWKKAGVSRLISGLRSKRAAGSPLVVETGFPTSLADLVVKNRGRLKKPSRKKKPSPDPDTASAAARSLPPPPPHAPRPAIPEAPRRPAVDEETRRPVPVGMKSRWYDFVVAKLFLLALLAIAKKNLVAGITISAFILLLLDSLGFRVFEFLRPSSDARRSLEGRECPSPIREAGIESQSDSSMSERIEEVSVGSDLGGDVLLERRDLFAVEKVCHDLNAGSSGNSKAKKKLWRRFVPKKFRGHRNAKDGKVLDSGSSGTWVSDSNREEDGGVSKEQEEEKQSDEQVLDFEISENIHPIRRNVHETRMASSRQLVFIGLVLLGLVGGRLVALMVIAVSFILTKLIETLRRRWRVHRIGSFL